VVPREARPVMALRLPFSILRRCAAGSGAATSRLTSIRARIAALAVVPSLALSAIALVFGWDSG